MAVINKITRLYPNNGEPIADESVQSHLDSMNADGWELIYVDNINGWYRLFWKKVT